MDKVRWEIKDGQLVKEAFDPNGIESFGHVQEHRTCQSPLAEIPGYPFDEAGQLQGRAMAGSKPKLFVPQQPTLKTRKMMIYCISEGETDIFKK